MSSIDQNESIELSADELEEHGSESNDEGDTAAADMGAAAASIPRRKHPVWQYFRIDKATNKSKCIICVDYHSDHYSTNLVNHMKSHHSRKYKLLVPMIDNWKKRKTDSPTPRIDTHFRSIGTKVARSSNSAAVNENIAKFAATTSFALLLTDDPFLKNAFAKLNHKLPCRQTLTKMIDTEYCKFFNRIKELVRDCRKMSLCADICTVRGMAHSYLAFTTQFYSTVTDRLENICLDVVNIESSHTAENIRLLTNEVLNKYDIRENKVSRYIIDNGSNMVATFKHTSMTLTVTDMDDCDDFHLIDANLDASFNG
jgi:hypothetical protein